MNVYYEFNVNPFMITYWNLKSVFKDQLGLCLNIGNWFDVLGFIEIRSKVYAKLKVNSIFNVAIECEYLI